MSQLKQNILANFIGKGLIALLTFVFLPVYICFLGIQAYGLVGFYITLQSVFFIFDAGLSTTLNRELARLSTQNGKEQEARDLVRTLEIIYFTVAIAIALIIVLLSPVISNSWIDSGTFSTDTIQQVVIMMGIAIAFQFPYSLYSGGLMGLQKQVLLNSLDVCITILRSAGAVIILWLISPTIQAFFIWQILVCLLQTIITSFCLWCSLPKAKLSPQFNKTILFKIFNFTAGIGIINVLAMLLMQMDKIILSKMLVLEMFGYYMLASSISSALGIIVVPLFAGIFPKLSQLVVQHDEYNLEKLYHQSCQIMSVIVLPIAVTIILFSPEILLAWTNNQFITERTYIIASILVAGTALNALMTIPYAFQLANGWTKLTLYQNFISVIILIPLIVFMAINYGAIGAASVWVILNGGYVLIGLYFMHKRLLKGELKKWYLIDVGLPLIGATFVPILIRLYIPLSSSMLITIIELLFILILSMVVSALLTPSTRRLLLDEYKMLSLRFLKLRDGLKS